MRKFLKDKLIQLLKTTEKYDVIMSQCSAAEKTSVLHEILVELQEIAIKIGNIIEKNHGVGTVTVNYLEEYCELLWNISKSESDDCFRKMINKLIGKRNEILISIERDITTRYEVVFLPYMATLWDSFDSVWKEAIKDEEVDVFVVPIPYYEKDESGNPIKVYYEQDKYPKDLNVVDYRKYNIEERHPDVIFIHNPYDEYNSTTSVLPSYYACELRYQTDMLVYIPYFVGMNKNIEEHLCVLPGSMYANKVIVDSELARNTYIRALQKFEEEKNCKGLMGDIEEKIVVAGSPKYDMLKVNIHNHHVPDDWNMMIVKEDGSRRKVVFYNTSIEEMLKHREAMLDKISETIEMTYMNDDVVLLWRPHPLLKAAIKANAPEIYDRYCEIVDDYIKKAKGIMDDSPDLYRAIGISDVYYGDRSSVVELYKKTNKMVMIQKCNCKAEDRRYMNLNACAGVVYKEKFYFTDLNKNGLFYMELSTGKVSLISLFARNKYCYMAYRDAYLYNNEAWFTPWKGNKILKINLDTLEMEYYDIPYKEKVDESKNVFHRVYASTGVIEGRYIYMIPAGYDTAVIIDMKEQKIYPYYEVIDVQKEYCMYGNIMKDKLLMYMADEQTIKCLNLYTGEVEKISGFDEVLEWKKESQGYKEQMDIYTEAILFDDIKWFVSWKAESIIYTELKTNESNQKVANQGIFMGKKAGYRVLTGQDKLVIKNTNDIFVWNSKDKRFVHYALVIDSNDMYYRMLEEGVSDLELLKQFGSGSSEIYEKYLSYEKYIENATLLSDSANKEESSGHIIWKNIKEEWL